MAELVVNGVQVGSDEETLALFGQHLLNRALVRLDRHVFVEVAYDFPHFAMAAFELVNESNERGDSWQEYFLDRLGRFDGFEGILPLLELLEVPLLRFSFVYLLDVQDDSLDDVIPLLCRSFGPVNILLVLLAPLLYLDHSALRVGLQSSQVIFQTLKHSAESVKLVIKFLQFRVDLLLELHKPIHFRKIVFQVPGEKLEVRLVGFAHFHRLHFFQQGLNVLCFFLESCNLIRVVIVSLGQLAVDREHVFFEVPEFLSDVNYGLSRPIDFALLRFSFFNSSFTFDSRFFRFFVLFFYFLRQRGNELANVEQHFFVRQCHVIQRSELDLHISRYLHSLSLAVCSRLAVHRSCCFFVSKY